MVMCADEFEKKENQKLIKIKKINGNIYINDEFCQSCNTCGKSKFFC